MKIFVNGGLGNQLFQFSYAHRAITKDKILEVYEDSNARDDRPFELKKIVSECSHNTVIKKTKPFSLKLRLAVIKRLASRDLFTLVRITQYFFRTDLEVKPFFYSGALPNAYKSRTAAGYFQHWKLVEEAWPTFGKEMMKTLSEITLPKSLESDVLGSLVMHVRQGDLNNVKDSMGILSLDYYLSAIDQMSKKNQNSKIFILTDDINGAQKTFQGQNIHEFLGPESLTAWQTLKLMSIAPNLVTANSTLSWWGGYIASKSGANVVMPKPWFKNWHEEVGDAFYFSGIETLESKYI